MRKVLLILLFVIGHFTFGAAQNVTRTQHRVAVITDAVTTGTVTIRKPDYICISTDGDKEQLIMDGTQFTMTAGGKQHVTDSRRNPLFATFHEVLKAAITGEPIQESEEVTVMTSNGLNTVIITPQAKKKKRQMFTSFVLVIDNVTSAFCQLRMNERGGNYILYDFK